jgi:hypothetical protein
MGRVNNLAGKIRQWEIGGKKLGSDPIQINNNNIFHVCLPRTIRLRIRGLPKYKIQLNTLLIHVDLCQNPLRDSLGLTGPHQMQTADVPT